MYSAVCIYIYILYIYNLYIYISSVYQVTHCQQAVCRLLRFLAAGFMSLGQRLL